MKNNDKIVLFQLTAGLDSALTMAMEKTYDIISLTNAKDLSNLLYQEMALLITCKGANFPTWPALNILILSPDQKIRLTQVMRHVDQIIKEPSLYMNDFNIQDVLFSVGDRTLHLKEGTIMLTDRETDILCFLAKNHLRLCHKNELLEKIWKYHPDIDTHTLETHIYRLRQKMGSLSEALTTNQDGGYQLRLQKNASL